MYHLYKGDIVGLSNRNTQAEESKGDSNKDVLGFGHDSVTLSDPHSERENQQTQKLRLKDTHTSVLGATYPVYDGEGVFLCGHVIIQLMTGTYVLSETFTRQGTSSFGESSLRTHASPWSLW